jgi:lysophospholipase
LTEEQLRILRYQLPPFGEGARPSAELLEFCRYYRVDFDRRIEGLQHLAGHVPSGDFRLAVQQWRQPGAVANLLIVHGYYDHTGLFGRLIEWGLEHRCNVVAFDLPGHGLSTGTPAVIDDFADYGHAIAAVLGRVRQPDLPLWVMGQSTGCAALVEFARAYDWPFDATVLLAPLVRPAGWRGIRAAHTLLGRLIDSVPRGFTKNSSDTDFLHFVRNDPLQCHRAPLRWVSALRRWLAGLPRADLGVGPALIVQGDHDHTVDWRYNVGFMADLFPGGRVDYVAGAGHQLANESEALRALYLEGVEAYLVEHGVMLSPGQE